MPATFKFSKRSLLIPGHSTYTAADWAEVTARILMLCDWGLPKAIISDRDRKFQISILAGALASFWHRDPHDHRIPPQGNGAAERKNQSVELAIRYRYANNPEGNWIDVIPAPPVASL